jgi:hypothetical protein
MTIYVQITQRKVIQSRPFYPITVSFYRFSLLSTIYSICFPLVSIGKNTIATKAARITAPLTNTGALGFAPGIFAAIIDAHKPAILFKKLEYRYQYLCWELENLRRVVGSWRRS